MVNNRYADYTKYSKLFESKLIECDFLREQKITVEDIINPLEDMITEEFIGKLIDKGKQLFQKGKEAVKSVASKVKNVVSKLFGGVVSFFKNFSIKKLISGIYNKIKELGSKVLSWFKSKLSGLSSFIVKNNMVNQDNTANIKNIWSVLCAKAKGLVNWEKEGVNPSQLQSVGDKIKLNEAESKYDISDQEVKYYGFFEKVVHAMGIKNARFNGVVSQIMKKGTYGLAIMSIMKLAGFSFAGLTAGLGMGPVATAAIGGMLLMAGIIILAIWICKPYPTLDDCLSYLHIAFGNNLKKVQMVSIFSVTVNIIQSVEINIDSTGGGRKKDKITDVSDVTEISKEELEEAKPLKSLYPTMISNLKSLRSLLATSGGVGLEGERSEDKDRELGERGAKYKTKRASEMVRKTKKVESFGNLVDFKDFDLILEKTFGKSRNVEVTGQESHLTQAVQKIRKSIKNLKDEKDKGVAITTEFLDAVLEEKNQPEAKDAIKNLFTAIYSYLYGKNKATLPQPDVLYKESVEVLKNRSKGQVVAEKISRFALRAMQFEGENLYGGIGEFGQDLKDYNKSLKEIMASIKQNESETKESFRYIQKFNNL